MTTSDITPFMCLECGGTVRSHTGPGRTQERRRGEMLPIPDDFDVPRCDRCGEEYVRADSEDELSVLQERAAGELAAMTFDVVLVHREKGAPKTCVGSTPEEATAHADRIERRFPGSYCGRIGPFATGSRPHPVDEALEIWKRVAPVTCE